MADKLLSVPPYLRRGALKEDETRSIDSGQAIIELMCKELQLEDLGDQRLLDMGCGIKLTQAFISRNIPILEYVGIDVYLEMIEFLSSAVTDKRFSFYRMDTHNAMYNPGGKPLGSDTRLPLEPGYFDLISLFSVFTHLAPHDYINMLKMLRPYIKPGGRLVFSVFIHEQTPGGHGLADGLKKVLEEQGRDTSEYDSPPDFHDAYEGKPLQWAMYSRKHALELIEGTGWEVESVNDPLPFIQHYIICKPV